MTATEALRYNNSPRFDSLTNHGLNESEVALLPIEVRYGLALDSEALRRPLQDLTAIETAIEEETGLTIEEQRNARKAILSQGENQGMQLNKSDEGMTLTLTIVGRHKLAEKIDVFKRQQSAS